ncbi:hypothetical protein LTR62_001184 [Meristemomyces frigidus]|uniref:Glutamyl-tRNA(Gln) amidotransferase subunit B, mitochondrial n=1 Tax=Meristemomyces frigidus TaxID=1508187 RepID=A0AAN7TGB8_9PEZI|nr:hypothetical protein LTR62_001184 [Meristemomyces frigidus]
MSVSRLRYAPLHLSRPSTGHLPATPRYPRACIVAKWLQSRNLTTGHHLAREEAIPLRKHLKDEAKRKKTESKALGGSGVAKNQKIDARLKKWELTVGIEIHAELNTACKLFSNAPAEARGVQHAITPNSRVALFDAAIPGTQPAFQVATLLPALRAAIALGCEVQRTSYWDRKHYFHWDQPNGYQITQYYRPFAKDGLLVLRASDGVPASDLNGAETLAIGIKQIQMEQDTAKTTNLGSSMYHIDLNRAGMPLVEIITLPHIHSPQTAAAVVRKIQSILKAVDACVTGLELGGLRADVNVSVRQRGTDGTRASYSGVGGLGQRTEIKNLSSFKAVEDAIIAERDRQIDLLEGGGVIAGETRGWTLGATETTRLRGKEGEVDYRYMPDADLHPLVIGKDLVEHLRQRLPALPGEVEAELEQSYGLTQKDAKTFLDLDDGDRVDYLEAAVAHTLSKLGKSLGSNEYENQRKVGKLAGNWILHELGGLLATQQRSWADMAVTSQDIGDIVALLHEKQITMRVAKQILADLFERESITETSTVEQLVNAGNLRLRPLTEHEYEELAQGIIDDSPDMVKAVKGKGQKGKIMWFVGQMVRRGEEGTVEPEKAKKVVERLIGSVEVS